MAPTGRHFTAWSLAALAVGLGLGIALHGSEASWAAMLDDSLRPVGRLWIVALQLTVVPLIFTQVVVAVMGTEHIGAMGAKTMGLFLVMLVAAGLFALLVVPPLVDLYPVDPAVVAALRAGVSAGDAAGDGLEGGTRMLGFIPAGVRRFFLGEAPLPLLLGAGVVALVAKRLPRPRRELFQSTFQWLSDATMRVVGWILLIAPLGVLALDGDVRRPPHDAAVAGH